MKIKQIRPLDNKYTSLLDSIALKPKLLYYMGDWPKQRIPTVAIVGARKNTKYGEKIAFELAQTLAKKGIIVVSGLAFGIDSIAARGALAGGGKTIAILGTEIERIYPAQHLPLAKEIIAKGGVIASEYHLGDKLYAKTSFLQRNRLISGLADAVVVVEAAEKSGSLNTAVHALDQGKDLYAVPGDLSRPMSAGTNRLIHKGANIYLGPEEFLLNFLPQTKRSKKSISTQISLFSDTPEEASILKLIADGIHDGDEIMEKLNMPIAVYNQTITMLEIKGAIISLGLNCWTLA
ncbi:DNA-processing protein DprA [Candidatus Saccharibacteria bacterium]|nr:DNA-processing protein DprA [Candidatus Saccharibacteria bacterium]